jgi:Mediator complex subunit MED14
VLRNVSNRIYVDLQRLIYSPQVQQQDPEMRTQTMRQFVSRTKKLLAQCLALVRSVRDDSARSFDLDVRKFHEGVQHLEISLNSAVDQLYYAHSNIFSKSVCDPEHPERVYTTSNISRPFEVAAAVDILARGTYAQLPESVGYIQKPAPPRPIPRQRLVQDLDIFLRAKLLYDDTSLPTDLYHRVSISEGILTINIPHVYKLSLTLSHLSEDADWVVVSVEVCSESHPDERLRASYSKRAIEQGLIDSLVKLAGSASRDNLTDTTALLSSGSIAKVDDASSVAKSLASGGLPEAVLTVPAAGNTGIRSSHTSIRYESCASKTCCGLPLICTLVTTCLRLLYI